MLQPLNYIAGKGASRVGRRYGLSLPLVYPPMLWYFSAEARR